MRSGSEVRGFILRAAIDGVWYWNLDQPDQEWTSPEFWETLGYPATAEHSQNWRDTIVAEDLETALSMAKRVALDPSSLVDQVLRYTHADGATVRLRCQGLAIRDQTGQATRLLAAHTKVDRQLHEGAIVKANNRLTAVLNAAQSGIVGLDANSQVTFANPLARDILRLGTKQVPFAWPQDVTFLEKDGLTEIEPANSPLQRALAGAEQRQETAILRCGTDLPRHVRISSTQVNEPFPDDVGTVLVLHDITEHERNRQRVERSSRLDALGQLTGGVAHDFNNLLATIEYSVQLALSPQTDPKSANYLKTALNSVGRGADLTRRLLTFARRQPGEAKSLYLPDVLKEFMAFVMPTIEAHIELKLDSGDLDMWVYCNHSQLENALLNLVLNSRDAIIRSGRGDQIILRARALAEIEAEQEFRDQHKNTFIASGLHTDHATARAHESDLAYRYVELAVSDNGPGMSGDAIRRAVDPFFTNKEEPERSGLGLSMVHGFIQQSNGELRIYSEIDLGTTVRLSLPRGTPEGTREQPVERIPLSTGKGQTIMIVEDEASLRDMITDLIASLGYKTETAISGVDALEKIRAGISLDLLLTDVVMPGDLDGFGLAAEFRKERPDIPILYMSGYTGFSEQKMGDVIAPIIQKPSPAVELAKFISAALEGNTGG